MKDLIQQLRCYAPLRCGETCPQCDAADMIEQLQHELTETQKERDYWKWAATGQHDQPTL